MITKTDKYKVDNPRKLKSWDRIARIELCKWINDEQYREEVYSTTMVKENMGSFTKFLYHFAHMCEAPWDVMVGFNEHTQRVFLTDKYYKWMHKLRSEIEDAQKVLARQ